MSDNNNRSPTKRSSRDDEKSVKKFKDENFQQERRSPNERFQEEKYPVRRFSEQKKRAVRYPTPQDLTTDKHTNSVHLMNDVETLSTRPNAFPFQIALILFTPESKDFKSTILDIKRYDIEIPRDEKGDYYVPEGYSMFSDTIAFWQKDNNIRAWDNYVQSKCKMSIRDALLDMSLFLSDYRIDKVCAFSPSFDCTIIKNAYIVEGLESKIPWHYRDEFDMRTIVHLNSQFFRPEYGYSNLKRDEVRSRFSATESFRIIAHDPIYDCLSQIYDFFYFYKNQRKLLSSSSCDKRSDNKEKYQQKEKTEQKKLLFMKTTANAIIPKKKSQGAAGYDIYCLDDIHIEPRSNRKCQTGISVTIPKGYEGKVSSRSGLSVDHMIECGAGVIDSDYRGEIGVVLYNHSDSPFEIEKGSRIAQLVIHKILEDEIVEEVLEMNETERGSGGFGSTGK